MKDVRRKKKPCIKNQVLPPGLRGIKGVMDER